jgi:hypothetical protein
MLVGRRDEKNVAAIEKLIGQPIARTIMEGLPEEHEKPQRSNDRHDGQRNREGRGRRSHNNRDSHHRAAHKASHHNSSPALAEEKALPAPQATAPQPAHRQQAPKPERPAQAPKQSSQSNGHDPSQLPAFLLRPVQLPPRPVKKTSAAELLPESSVNEG